MAAATLPTGQQILPMPPLTPGQAKVQRDIDKFNKMTYPEIQGKWGDVKPKYVPTFKDSIWAGKLDPAREHFRMGFGRAYNVYALKRNVLCILSTGAALPAKIGQFVYHLLSACCSKHSRDMLRRDVKDLKDATGFIVFGTFAGIGHAALTVLYDPFDWAYHKCTNKGSKGGLIHVDPQWDFCPAGDILIDGKLHHYDGGSLAVNGAWDIFPVINKLQKAFKGTIVGCKDWHPIKRQPHGSFAKMLGVAPFTLTTLNGRTQKAWPIHCVQGSRGAEYVPALDQSRIQDIVVKGLNPRIDSYSGFADADGNNTRMEEILKKKGVTDVFVDGLAFDYCVGYTALDAQKAGFKVTVIEDATRSVAADSQADMKALLLQKGIRVVNSTDLIGKDPFFPAVSA
jgi:nicotinamidase/pyrazinamidase